MYEKRIIDGYKPYPNSVNYLDGKTIYMSREGIEDILITVGGDMGFEGKDYTVNGLQHRKSQLSHNNACNLRRLFPFTAPSPILSKDRTIGLGDRLGIACPGHIKVLEKHDVHPIFAQQSIRELNLTGRTYEDVLDSATFAVYREGFRRGFGADGDHLKKSEEIDYALSCGYTMITLDCSEHIRNDVAAMSDEQIEQEYDINPEIEELYVGKTFDIGEGNILAFDEAELKRTVLIYNKAIDFACSIYRRHIKNNNIDFEISIDETETSTTPLQHFFVANELVRRGVKFITIAPRFYGEFQKGVDYIGDLERFEREFAVHASISRYFGYKISVHSGSDKFSVFPIIGKLTRGRYHVKTAGTNWLEAMKLVAMKEPKLYREIHTYALEVFEEARKYYHVTTLLDKVHDVYDIDDDALPLLFNNNDARQLIHITYGLILNKKKEDGTYLFRDNLYKLWGKYSQAYSKLLEQHIGAHLELLGNKL